jgi:hypothetical protein
VNLGLVTFTVGLLVTMGGSARAADVVQNIDDSVPIFCRDGTGAFQPFVRTNYDRLSESFTRQFGWQHSLRSVSPTLGYLVFSETGERTAPETIIYDVQPYSGGIALLHMHVRLKGKKENLSGTEMCFRTFAIVNVR